MQAKAEFGGRLARCPACGENVIIPGGSGGRSNRIGPEQPTPAPKQSPKTARRVEEEEEDIPEVEAVEDEDDYDDEDEEIEERPRSRSRGKPSKANKSGGSRVLLWICLILLLLLVPGGALGWWLWSGKASPTAVSGVTGSTGTIDDLTFVPGNMAGFVVLRPADIVATPAGQRAIQSLPAEARTPFAVATLNELERLSVVFAEFNPAKQQDSVWVVMRSTKPFDKDQVLKGFRDQFKTQEFEGKTYYAPATNGSPAVWFAGDRVLVLGEEVALKRAMALPTTRTTGPLDAAMGEIESKRHIVMAIVPPAAPDKQGGVVPLQAQQMQKLAATKLITLTGDVADGLTLNLSLKYDSEQKAKDAKNAFGPMLQSLKPMVMFATAAGANQMKGDNPGKTLTTILDSIKPEQEGSTVHLKVALDAATLATLSALATKLAMPPGPAPAVRRGIGNPGAAPPTAATGAPRRTPRVSRPGTAKP
jgi:hypothetical protein